MSAEASRDLFASVATYSPPSVATAIELLGSAFNRLIAPAVDPQTSQIAVAWCRANSQRQQRAPLSASVWDKVRQAGPLAWLLISGWREANIETANSPSVAAVTMHWASDARRASVIEYSLQTSLLGGTISLAIQTEIVAWTETAWQQLAGTVGLITVDFVSANVMGSMSPYERSGGLSYPWAALDFREKVRGYYWGNLLSQQHVALLGGPGRLANAPVAEHRALAHDGYYLQLSDDLNRIDRGDLQQLKALVEPLLPEGYQQAASCYQSLPDLLI